MKTIKVTLSEFDKKVLEHDLKDVQRWVQDALNGKINRVKKRLTKEAQEKLFNDSNIASIPASVSGSISLYFDQPYYQNRNQIIAKIEEERSE